VPVEKQGDQETLGHKGYRERQVLKDRKEKQVF